MRGSETTRAIRAVQGIGRG